jgi:diaminopimelate epimerase
MKLEIVRADPAGNITIFFFFSPQGKDAQAEAARALMADPALKAEQVGFVMPPEGPPAREGGLWRLRMNGDEFCGNASRSFGLLVAKLSGISGKASLMVEVSGAKQPLAVRVDTDSGDAELDIPGPIAEETVEFQGRHFPLYIFEGISHAIAEDMPPDEQLVFDLAKQAAPQVARHAEQICLSSANHGAGYQLRAFGVMFYDTRRRFMQPLVWVKNGGLAPTVSPTLSPTVAPESSCGSGSAALAVWAARDLPDADQWLDIAQPGGTIRTRVIKQQGKVRAISIGGKVYLEGP